jgi:hypothetical protein
MVDGTKPKANIILPKLNKPKLTDLRNDTKGSQKQNGYTAPKNVIRKAGPRGG